MLIVYTKKQLGFICESWVNNSKKTVSIEELISDNKNYNSEIIQKSELDTIQILGKVVGKVGLVW